MQIDSKVETDISAEQEEMYAFWNKVILENDLKHTKLINEG